MKSKEYAKTYFNIRLEFPDGKKIEKSNCSMQDVFETYFINLDKQLNKDITGEELFNKYQKYYKSKGVKIYIQYSDSWGHLWKGKVAFPKKEWFLDYLNKRINQ